MSDERCRQPRHHDEWHLRSRAEPPATAGASGTSRHHQSGGQLGHARRAAIVAPIYSLPGWRQLLGASAATAQLVFCPDLPVGSMTALTMMQTTPRNAEITPKIVNAKPKARRIRATPKAMSTARIGTIVCRDPGSSVVPDRCRSAACGHRASLVRGGVKPRQKHAPFSCQSHGSSVRVREDNGSAHVASWVGQPFWSQGVIGRLGRGIGLTGGGYYSAHGGTR